MLFPAFSTWVTDDGGSADDASLNRPSGVSTLNVSAPQQFQFPSMNLHGINSFQVQPPQMQFSQILPLSQQLIMHAPNQPVAEFLYQLTRMLRDQSNRDVIEWTNARIVVHDPHRLENEILQNYFRHSKFASFQRQLNYFGFRKLAGKGKMSPCSYINDEVTEDLGSLLLIKRKTNGNSAARRSKEAGSNLCTKKRMRTEKDCGKSKILKVQQEETQIISRPCSGSSIIGQASGSNLLVAGTISSNPRQKEITASPDDEDFLFDLSANFRDFSSHFLSQDRANDGIEGNNTSGDSTGLYLGTGSNLLHSCSSLVDLASVSPMFRSQPTDLENQEGTHQAFNMSSYGFLEPTPVENMSDKSLQGFSINSLPFLTMG